jgi:PAS domain S-box-containing protein
MAATFNVPARVSSVRRSAADAALLRLATRLTGGAVAALFDEAGARSTLGREAAHRLEPLRLSLARRGSAAVGDIERDEELHALASTVGACAWVTLGPERLMLIVGDERPREWPADVVEILTEIARAAAALDATAAGAATSLNGSWTWDLGTDAVTWSDEVSRIFGIPPGETVSGVNPFLQFAHRDDAEIAQDAIRSAVRDGKELALAYRIVPPGSGERWIRLTGRVVDMTGDGDASLIVGTCEDLTSVAGESGNRARALENAAERRGTLLAAVVETMREVARSELDVHAMTQRIARRAMQLTNADGAVFGMPDSDSIVSRATAGVHEALGDGLTVPLGHSLAGYCLESGDVVRCDDMRLDPRAATRLVEQGIRSSLHVPLTYRRETLGVLSVVSRHASAFTDDDGHLLQLMAGVSAALISHASAFRVKTALVQERTEALEALREAHEMLAIIVRASPLPITTVAPDFTVTTWNPAAERLFGWRADEVMGQQIPTLPEDESEESQRRRLALASGAERMQAYEERRRRRDGTTIDVGVSAATLMDAEGRPRGIVSIYHDVTERRRLEQRLRQAQRMEAVGQLAGGIAHDFNNLLTIMQLHAESLTEELPAGSDLHADAAEIQRQTERAASLTRQLLAFSRKQLLQPRPLDLNVTVREVEKMLRRVIGEDIALETQLERELGQVMADPNQIVQVLLNLAVNGRDAMPAGGRLSIRTANVWLDSGYGDLHGAVVPEGEYVMLAVSDTGTGMDRATQQRIFEPFFTTKEPGRGTGLGLATVYGIVKQSGGYIWVYSEPGLGSTFKIYLPRMIDEARMPAIVDRVVDVRGTETILLVEDEEELRDLARMHLEHLGYTVLVGQSGDDALRIATELPGSLHLLITDVVMPGLSGAEIAERLRALRPEVRVLFMSGYTDDDIVRRGLLAPRQSMLHKPFSRRALAAAVRSALDAGAA